MKPQPCFEVNKMLEAVARDAEERKNRAIERLTEKLGMSNKDRFDQARRNPIGADKRVLEEKGR
jgi:hypothetical protein